MEVGNTSNFNEALKSSPYNNYVNHQQHDGHQPDNMNSKQPDIMNAKQPTIINDAIQFLPYHMPNMGPLAYLVNNAECPQPDNSQNIQCKVEMDMEGCQLSEGVSDEDKAAPQQTNAADVKVKSVQPKHACDFCAKLFRSKPGLEAHRLEVHLGVVVPKVQCNICGSWLKNKNAKYQHTRNIHGERKHRCTVCVKAFTKAISLKEHMSLHTGEDLYTCTYCPKTFKWSSNMYTHRKKVHLSKALPTAAPATAAN